MTILPISHRILATAHAESMMYWLQERIGKLALLQVVCDRSSGEVAWCPVNTVVQDRDYFYWGQLVGCPFFVHRSDRTFLQTRTITLELAYENGDVSNTYSGFRFLTEIRPLSEEESAMSNFAQERNAAEATRLLMEKLQR